MRSCVVCEFLNRGFHKTLFFCCYIFSSPYMWPPYQSIVKNLRCYGKERKKKAQISEADQMLDVLTGIGLLVRISYYHPCRRNWSVFILHIYPYLVWNSLLPCLKKKYLPKNLYIPLPLKSSTKELLPFFSSIVPPIGMEVQSP